MRRVARILLCTAIAFGLMAPAIASAQTYVEGNPPAVGGTQADAGIAEENSTGGAPAGADVLGETIERPASGNTRVLGSTFEREDSGGVGGNVFAATGIAVGSLLLLAGALILVGAILRRQGTASEA